jgi:hypothetical protein
MARHPEYKNRKLQRSKDRGIIYYKYKKSLKQELNGILQRLEKDTGSYLQLSAANNYQFGYFAMIRLLTPTIEHIAQILPKKKGINSRDWLLSKLGITFPNIFMHLYRHSLIHGDEPAQIEVGLQIVTWYLTFGHNTHKIEEYGVPVKSVSGVKLPHPLIIYIDLKKLYDDLVVFLKETISNTPDNKNTYVQNSTRFIKSKLSNKTVVNEVKEVKILLNNTKSN